jgi:hypothetical protein
MIERPSMRVTKILTLTVMARSAVKEGIMVTKVTDRGSYLRITVVSAGLGIT